jgi:hypothetical protein
MVLPVCLGRSLDRNGSGTDALDCKAMSFPWYGTGFWFVPYQKEVICAMCIQYNRPRTVIRTRVMRGLRERWSGTKRSEKLPLCATFLGKVNLASRLEMAENVRPTRLAFRHG